MGYKDAEVPNSISPLFQSVDEFALYADDFVRRLRANSGTPILNAYQLSAMSVRREERFMVNSVYDQFGPRLKAETRDPS